MRIISLKKIVCACPNYAAFTNLNISLLLIIIFFSPVSVMGLIEPLVNLTLYIKFQVRRRSNFPQKNELNDERQILSSSNLFVHE